MFIKKLLVNKTSARCWCLKFCLNTSAQLCTFTEWWAKTKFLYSNILQLRLSHHCKLMIIIVYIKSCIHFTIVDIEIYYLQFSYNHCPPCLYHAFIISYFIYILHGSQYYELLVLVLLITKIIFLLTSIISNISSNKMRMFAVRTQSNIALRHLNWRFCFYARWSLLKSRLSQVLSPIFYLATVDN